jgi:hypothetical protein
LALAFFASIFILFLEASLFFLDTFSLYLLFLSILASYSFIDPECAETKMRDDPCATSSPSFF